MPSFKNNYRYFRLISLSILVLFLSTPKDIFAYKEKQARTTNNRLWSIIEGKVEFIKSSYSLEKVRVSTPKPEQFQSTSQTKYERITSRQLQKNQLIPINYILKPRLDFEVLIITMVLIILMSMLAAFIPARYAIKLSPVEALRSNK